MGTCGACLIGLTRIHASEGNTVFFTAHLNNIQQFPIIPVAGSLTEIFHNVGNISQLLLPDKKYLL